MSVVEEHIESSKRNVNRGREKWSGIDANTGLGMVTSQVKANRHLPVTRLAEIGFETSTFEVRISYFVWLPPVSS